VRGKLERIGTLSVDELKVRGSQKLAAFTERLGWTSLAKLPADRPLLGMLEPANCGGRLLGTEEELLEHFRDRNTVEFFTSFADRDVATTQIKQRWPEQGKSAIDQAKRIGEGHFRLLGYDDLTFGTPVDWHFEPIAGKQSPFVHWSKIDYLNPDIVGDSKIIWELNRHQYFTILGLAYWLTGDERYTKTFVAHLTSWMDENPPKLGINWVSSLEIAFRSISWIWAFYFFKDSPAFESQVFVRLLKFLYLNARHLETYLSTYFSPNTHLTGEALGLFYLGLFLFEFKEAARWRDAGSNILLQRLPLHVQSDGVYFEQASYYHRYTTDIYSHFFILTQLNSCLKSSKIESGLEALLDHLMHITRPDGSTPFIGDDDGGRLVMLDQRAANDFRASLSTGAALFERSDYKFVAGEPAMETLWLMGPAGLWTLDELREAEPAARSVAFESSGYYVMRDDWSATANYLLFDCGPHGHVGCGHSHADALSFELAVNGRTLLVDPGTYTYTGSKELRDWFRSTAAHNSLTLDRRSSSISAGAFSWKTVAQAKARAWISRDRFDYVSGVHDGFVRNRCPAVHERSIIFLKRDYWIMRDRVEARGPVEVELWFHFEPHAEPSIKQSDHNEFTTASVDNGLNIVAFATDGKWRLESGWVSTCYGHKEPAPVCVFSVPLVKGGDIVTFLLPDTYGSRSHVTPLKASGGKAFEVVKGNWRDLSMIRQAELFDSALSNFVTTDSSVRMFSDFDYTWVRFRHDDALPFEILLLGGTTLALEGKQILKTHRRIEYLFASRLENGVRVETTDRVWNTPVSDFFEAFSLILASGETPSRMDL